MNRVQPTSPEVWRQEESGALAYTCHQIERASTRRAMQRTALEGVELDLAVIAKLDFLLGPSASKHGRVSTTVGRAHRSGGATVAAHAPSRCAAP